MKQGLVVEDLKNAVFLVDEAMTDAFGAQAVGDGSARTGDPRGGPAAAAAIEAGTTGILRSATCRRVGACRGWQGGMVQVCFISIAIKCTPCGSACAAESTTLSFILQYDDD